MPSYDKRIADLQAAEIQRIAKSKTKGKPKIKCFLCGSALYDGVCLYQEDHYYRRRNTADLLKAIEAIQAYLWEMGK